MVGLDDLRRAFLTSIILWFYEAVGQCGIAKWEGNLSFEHNHADSPTALCISLWQFSRWNSSLPRTEEPSRQFPGTPKSFIHHCLPALLSPQVTCMKSVWPGRGWEAEPGGLRNCFRDCSFSAGNDYPSSLQILKTLCLAIYLLESQAAA